jgi:hypothetical protein
MLPDILGSDGGTLTREARDSNKNSNKLFTHNSGLEKTSWLATTADWTESIMPSIIYK